MASRFSGAFVFETKDGKRYRYRYRAVTSDGHGVHSIDYVSLAACRRAVNKIKGTWPDAEVQRVRELMRGDEPWARQYELEHKGRWLPDTKVKAFREQGI